MFEVGRAYEFTLLEAGEDGPAEGTMVWTVHAVDGPLLHLRNPARTGHEYFPDTPERNMILNTGSLFFHSARPAEEAQAGFRR